MYGFPLEIKYLIDQAYGTLIIPLNTEKLYIHVAFMQYNKLLVKPIFPTYLIVKQQLLFFPSFGRHFYYSVYCTYLKNLTSVAFQIL